ncbi:hypothetical protein FB451DRAFT_1170570 [Mycena latifolia]|nr:hypothetical protein FB451DRAFT_1170570 [Mycena latifolia]
MQCLPAGPQPGTCDALMILWSICNSWTDIALSVPPLWAAIHADKPVADLPRVLVAWFGRSGSERPWEPDRTLDPVWGSNFQNLAELNEPDRARWENTNSLRFGKFPKPNPSYDAEPLPDAYGVLSGDSRRSCRAQVYLRCGGSPLLCHKFDKSRAPGDLQCKCKYSSQMLNYSKQFVNRGAGVKHAELSPSTPHQSTWTVIDQVILIPTDLSLCWLENGGYVWRLMTKVRSAAISQLELSRSGLGI